MKKLLSSLLALMMVFSLSACGASQANAGQSDPDLAKAKETVENYYKAIQSGELDSLQDYCTDQFAKDNEFEEFSNQMNDLSTQIANQTDLSDQFNDFMNSVWGNIIREYKVGKVTKKDEKIKVVVTTKGVDTVKLESIDVNAILNSVIAENQDRINAVASEEEQNALFNDLMTQFIARMKEEVNNMESVETKSRLTLIKEEDEWLIDKEVHLDS